MGDENVWSNNYASVGGDIFAADKTIFSGVVVVFFSLTQRKKNKECKDPPKILKCKIKFSKRL